MQISIIVIKNLIYINEKGFVVDCSAFPDNIIAAHWSDDRGYISLKDDEGINNITELTSDFSLFETAIIKYNEQKSIFESSGMLELATLDYPNHKSSINNVIQGMLDAQNDID